MERDLVEKAKSIVDQIDRYSNIQKILLNPDFRIGINAGKGYTYIELTEPELREKLLKVSKECVAEKITELQKQLNEL